VTDLQVLVDNLAFGSGRMDQSVHVEVCILVGIVQLAAGFALAAVDRVEPAADLEEIAAVDQVEIVAVDLVAVLAAEDTLVSVDTRTGHKVLLVAVDKLLVSVLEENYKFQIASTAAVHQRCWLRRWTQWTQTYSLRAPASLRKNTR
jgi:hypothetical protein